MGQNRAGCRAKLSKTGDQGRPNGQPVKGSLLAPAKACVGWRVSTNSLLPNTSAMLRTYLTLLTIYCPCSVHPPTCMQWGRATRVIISPFPLSELTQHY
jgi:hypothetical protein